MAVTSIGQFMAHQPFQRIIKGESPQFVSPAQTKVIQAVSCEALAEVATECLGGIGCSVVSGRVPVLGPLVGTLFDSSASLTGVPLGVAEALSPKVVRWAAMDGWARCKESLRKASDVVARQVRVVVAQSQSRHEKW
jgi:hypothetical protein